MTLRCGVYCPDWILLLDPHLLENPAAFSGLKERGSILVNGRRLSKEIRRPPKSRVFVVDAGAISHRLRLGNPSFPIVNTAMAGAFARASGLISLVQVIGAIQEAVPVEKEKNADSAREAYENVREVRKGS